MKNTVLATIKAHKGINLNSLVEITGYKKFGVAAAADELIRERLIKSAYIDNLIIYYDIDYRENKEDKTTITIEPIKDRKKVVKPKVINNVNVILESGLILERKDFISYCINKGIYINTIGTYKPIYESLKRCFSFYLKQAKGEPIEDIRIDAIYKYLEKFNINSFRILVN